MAHVYSLGAVKPWVKDAAYEIGNKFDVGTIYGVGARAHASDHPKGLATDFMVYTDRAKGDSIAAYLKANWQRLRVKYILWQQRIDEGNGWQPMEDRGGATANHRDHVHVSYQSSGEAGVTYGGNQTDTATTDDSGISGAAAKITSSATWIRILEFLVGVLLIAGVVWSVITSA